MLHMPLLLHTIRRAIFGVVFYAWAQLRVTARITVSMHRTYSVHNTNIPYVQRVHYQYTAHTAHMMSMYRTCSTYTIKCADPININVLHIQRIQHQCTANTTHTLSVYGTYSTYNIPRFHFLRFEPWATRAYEVLFFFALPKCIYPRLLLTHT